MTNDEFDKTYYPAYSDTIYAIATKLARLNEYLVDDLYQIGLITMWELDMSLAKTNPKSYITQAVKNKMVDYLRKAKLNRHESLDTLLDFKIASVSKGPNGNAQILWRGTGPVWHNGAGIPNQNLEAMKDQDVSENED